MKLFKKKKEKKKTFSASPFQEVQTEKTRALYSERILLRRGSDNIQ